MELLIINDVYIWRENKGQTGPYKLLAFNYKKTAAIINIKGYQATFRITSVRPYYSDNTTLLPPNRKAKKYLSDDHLSDDEYTPITEKALIAAKKTPIGRRRGRLKGSKNKPKQ